MQALSHQYNFCYTTQHLGVHYRYVADPITAMLQPDLGLVGIAVSKGQPPDPAAPGTYGTSPLPPALLTHLEAYQFTPWGT